MTRSASEVADKIVRELCNGWIYDDDFKYMVEAKTAEILYL